MTIWSLWKSTPHAALLPQESAGSISPPAPTAGPLALDTAATGRVCRVLSVQAPDQLPDWGRWLAEIGFLPGEQVTVTTRSVWGGDPMVVRIGQSTFALRRAEAACVQVEAV
jgi:ferrous iron transport protein A